MTLGLTTSGLWKLRREVELVTGVKTKYTRFGFGADAIAGWGHKPTAQRARQIARKRRKPYLALEDGFLRSVEPGNTEPPLSLVFDRTGIYYDSRQPSDLEALVSKRSSVSSRDRRISSAMELLRESRLSKYNKFQMSEVTGLGLSSASPTDRAMIVDQTVGDASIEGGMATSETFEIMLVQAVQDNPGCEFLIKIHPETMFGRKPGHFSAKQLTRLAQKHTSIQVALTENRLRLTPESVNPWALLEACSRVYCVSSQLGFEALLAGCEVHCFGMPFYAGWNITEDHNPASNNRRVHASLEAMFAAVYFDYCHYVDHESFSLIEFEEALTVLENRISSSSYAKSTNLGSKQSKEVKLVGLQA